MAGNSPKDPLLHQAIDMSVINASNEDTEQCDNDGFSLFLKSVCDLDVNKVKSNIKIHECRKNFRNDLGNHALHILVDKLDENETKVFEILDVFIEEGGFDVDPKNNRGKSPLDVFRNKHENKSFADDFYKKIYSLIAKTFDNESNCSNCFFSKQDFLNAIKMNPSLEIPNRPWQSMLYDSIILKDIVLLNQIIENRQVDEIKTVLNFSIGSQTILFYAVDRLWGIEFIRKLLDNNADPFRKSVSGELPIHRALARGKYEYVTLLIEQMKRLDGAFTVKSLSFSFISKLTQNDIIDKRLQCLNYLIDNGLDLNACSSINNQNYSTSVIHLAAKSNDKHFVKQVIVNGARLMSRRKIMGFDMGSAIEDIPLETLKEAMDDCITNTGRQCVKECESVRLNYKFLVSSTTNGDCESEIKELMEIAELRSCRELMKHPLLKTLLSIKWNNLYMLYLIDSIMCLIFLIVSTLYMCSTSCYIVTNCTQVFNNNSEQEINCTNIYPEFIQIKIYKAIVYILLFYKVVREVLYPCLRIRNADKSIIFKLLLKNKLNFLSSVLLLSSYVMLFLLTLELFNSTEFKHISSWIIIISWYQIIETVCSLFVDPIYIIMINKVTRNFLIMIAVYGSLILAFGLSFYIMLSVNTDEDSNKDFLTFWSAIPKIIAMTTGEFDYSDLSEGFATEVFYRISNVFMFLVFLFIIFLVVMNVMTGIAVCDTQDARKSSEVNTLVNNLKQIYLTETVCNKIKSLITCNWCGDNKILTGPGTNGTLVVNVGDRKECSECYQLLDLSIKEELRSYCHHIVEQRDSENKQDILQECKNLQEELRHILNQIKK